MLECGVIIDNPSPGLLALAHRLAMKREIIYGVTTGDAMCPDSEDPEYAQSPLLNEAMNMWSYAGYLFGCLVDGRDAEPQPRQRYI